MMMARKTRILFVSHMGSQGGAQRCLWLICKGIDRERFEPEAVVPEEGELAHDLRALGVEVHVVPLHWWVTIQGRERAMEGRFRRGLASRVGALERLIAARGFDVVVSNTSVVAEGALAAARSGVPHVWHVLEMLASDPRLRPRYRLPLFYWLIDRLSSAVVVVSGSVRDEMVGQTADARPEVVHTGIESLDRERLRMPKPRLFGADELAPVICFAGELSERKGILTLIEAAPAVLRTHPDALFAVAGWDGGQLRAARQLARASGVAGRIRFLGRRNDALALIASSDVLAQPSLSDPFPVSVLEGMALATPVVATRSGGAAEMIEDGRTGRLVAPASAADLAAAISSLLSDPAAAQRMGEAARRHAREAFSLRAAAAAFERVLLDASRSREPARAAEAGRLAELLVAEAENKRASPASLLIERASDTLRLAVGKRGRMASTAGDR
jgi:glycosyltransferase involved in cell wall biosynthesis